MTKDSLLATFIGTTIGLSISVTFLLVSRNKVQMKTVEVNACQTTQSNSEHEMCIASQICVTNKGRLDKYEVTGGTWNPSPKFNCRYD